VFDELDALLRQPGAITGGSRAALTIPWERTAAMLVEAEPSCLMAHHADFLRRELPAGITIGDDADIDFFQLPGTDDAIPPPLVVGGMLAAPLADSPAVTEAMTLLAGSDVAERLDRTGEFLSPHLDVDRAAGADATSIRLLDLVAASSPIEFDGSDVMPAPVGTGTFWTGMARFFAGDDIRSIVDEIDRAWPGDVDTS
jgi:alpha-glucoside transport system substrate-binding protein